MPGGGDLPVPLDVGYDEGRAIWFEPASRVLRWHREQGFLGIQFNTVVETNQPAVHLWQSLGFRIVGTVPGAFRHPRHGYVGLHVMYLPMTAR